MNLVILTLNWNGKDKLIKLKDGLFNNLAILKKEGIDSTWYIKDNGSKDGSIEEINSWNCSVKLYEIGHNRDNFAEGVNYLFDKANPDDNDLVLLLNNDITFIDDCSLKNMVDLIQKPNIGIVGARLLYTNTNKIQSGGTIFSRRYNNLPYHFRAGEESDNNAKISKYFQAVTAAVAFVKASSFRRVGGWDCGFRWAFCDVDFCLRVGQQEKIAYCGKTNIYHDESYSLKKNSINKLNVQHNVKYFREKWNGKYDIDHDKYLENPHYNEIKD